MHDTIMDPPASKHCSSCVLFFVRILRLFVCFQPTSHSMVNILTAAAATAAALTSRALRCSMSMGSSSWLNSAQQLNIVLISLPSLSRFGSSLCPSLPL